MLNKCLSLITNKWMPTIAPFGISDKNTYDPMLNPSKLQKHVHGDSNSIEYSEAWYSALFFIFQNCFCMLPHIVYFIFMFFLYNFSFENVVSFLLALSPPICPFSNFMHYLSLFQTISHLLYNCALIPPKLCTIYLPLFDINAKGICRESKE